MQYRETARKAEQLDSDRRGSQSEATYTHRETEATANEKTRTIHADEQSPYIHTCIPFLTHDRMYEKCVGRSAYLRFHAKRTARVVADKAHL